MSDNSSDRYGSMLAVLGDKDDDRGRLFLDDLFSLYKANGNRVTVLAVNMGAIGVHVATKGSSAKKEVAKYYNDLVGRTADFSSGDELKYVQSLGTSTNELEKFFKTLIQVVGNVKRGGNSITLKVEDWHNADNVTIDMTKVASLLRNLVSNSEINAEKGNTDTVTMWSINTDKFFMQKLFESVSNAASASVGASKDFFGDVETNDFVRNENDDLVDANTKQAVGHGSNAYKNLTAASDCFTTGYKGDSGKCTSYMKQCLIGQDIKGCATFLADKSFWGNMAEEVKNMNPAIAVDTLRAFGFAIEEGENGTKSSEDTSDWLKSLGDKGLSADDVKNITSNAKLVSYLDAVVARVNSNPAILNRKKAAAPGLSGTCMQKYGIKAKVKKVRPCVASMYRISNCINAHNMRLSVLLGVSPIVGIVGGGAVADIEKRESAEPLWASAYFARMFSSINNTLESLGKKIQDDDKKTVTDMIDNLRDSEEKLYKTMKYAAKYHALLEIYGEEHNPSTLNMDTLQKFVDARNKYFVKTSKRQSSLAGVLTAIVKTINGEVSVGSINWPDTV
tara:strand:+ start:721 stop:2409 length:1689 start_codon:yes stop_codon:yes gene_type:complete